MGSNEANIKDKLYENYEDSLWKVLMYEFGVNFDVVDISRMYTIGDIKKILKKYGVKL